MNKYKTYKSKRFGSPDCNAFAKPEAPTTNSSSAISIDSPSQAISNNSSLE